MPMSAADEIQRFAADVKTDQALLSAIKALGADQDAILRLANSKGYAFTMADVEALGGGELSDEQLAGVAGGSTILYTDGTTTLTGGSSLFVYKSTKSVLVW
jgi:predicted ribosomally synthesized peptide with nif11-like leader